MPADEMMATVTRPIEEAMKEIPGAVSVRSETKRGSAEINIFFNWQVDMQRSELYVLGRLAEIRAELPASASTEVERVTFSAFPIIGISLTSSNRNIMDLWETGNYTHQAAVSPDSRRGKSRTDGRQCAGISRACRRDEIAGGAPGPGRREQRVDEK